MLHLSNPFPRLRAWLRKPVSRGRATPARPTRPRSAHSLGGFGPQVAMRLYRAQRAAQRNQGE